MDFFYHMSGLGNTFLIFEVPDQAEVARFRAQICASFQASPWARQIDQVILLQSQARAASITIYNRDGSEAEACGNATRCVAWLLGTRGYQSTLLIYTKGGALSCEVYSQERVAVTYPWPKIQKITQEVLPGIAGPWYQVAMGNPHLVLVAPPATVKIEKVGPALQQHPLFPGGINVELAWPQAGAYRMQVWERGVGLTQSCGTGACAVAAVMVAYDNAMLPCQIEQPLGPLKIAGIPDREIILEGPVTLHGTYQLTQHFST